MERKAIRLSRCDVIKCIFVSRDTPATCVKHDRLFSTRKGPSAIVFEPRGKASLPVRPTLFRRLVGSGEGGSAVGEHNITRRRRRRQQVGPVGSAEVVCACAWSATVLVARRLSCRLRVRLPSACVVRRRWIFRFRRLFFPPCAVFRIVDNRGSSCAFRTSVSFVRRSRRRRQFRRPSQLVSHAGTITERTRHDPIDARSKPWGPDKFAAEFLNGLSWSHVRLLRRRLPSSPHCTHDIVTHLVRGREGFSRAEHVLVNVFETRRFPAFPVYDREQGWLWRGQCVYDHAHRPRPSMVPSNPPLTEKVTPFTCCS